MTPPFQSGAFHSGLLIGRLSFPLEDNSTSHSRDSSFGWSRWNRLGQPPAGNWPRLPTPPFKIDTGRPGTHVRSFPRRGS